MTIGIILHPYGEDKPAGLARGILEFTRGMIANDTENEYIVFLKEKPRVEPDFPGDRWRVVTLDAWRRGFQLGNRVSKRLWLRRLKYAPQADVYLFNTPVLPLFWKPARAVVLAWDYGYLMFPPDSLRDAIRKRLVFFYQRWSLQRADHVIAVSEATRRETVRLSGIPAEKISVVHCGYKKVCDAEQVPMPLPDNFFLFIGVVKERKNVFNIVRAFTMFRTLQMERDGTLRTLCPIEQSVRSAVSRPDYHLVIGGNAEGEYANAVRAFIEKENIGTVVHFIGHLNDGQLSYIYRRAEALVFPSFVEGFGYPILEAMDCGIPVITSDQSSLAEVGGDAALLVDPHSPQAIAAAMTRIADEVGLRDALIQKGNLWKQNFLWDKAGKEMIEILISIGLDAKHNI